MPNDDGSEFWHGGRRPQPGDDKYASMSGDKTPQGTGNWFWYLASVVIIGAIIWYFFVK